MRIAPSSTRASRRFLALFAALSSASCTELSARWNDHLIYYGTVQTSDPKVTLTSFCAETLVERSDAIVFSAPAGAMLEEEVFVEGRTEKYFGVPPDRPPAFWCSDLPQIYLHPLNFWVCLRAADDDPPATIVSVEPRGELAMNGASSGYALELEVRHPGVLRVVLDEACLSERTGSIVDAGTSVPQGELTIQ